MVLHHSSLSIAWGTVPDAVRWSTSSHRDRCKRLLISAPFAFIRALLEVPPAPTRLAASYIWKSSLYGALGWLLISPLEYFLPRSRWLPPVVIYPLFNSFISKNLESIFDIKPFESVWDPGFLELIVSSNCSDTKFVRNIPDAPKASSEEEFVWSNSKGWAMWFQRFWVFRSALHESISKIQWSLSGLPPLQLSPLLEL